MESINELFHETYNAQHGLPHYKEKLPPFTKEEMFNYTKRQHEFLESQSQQQQQQKQNKEIIIFLIREVTEDILKRYEAVAANLSQQVYLITDTYYPHNTHGKLIILYFYENFCHIGGFFYLNTDTMPDKLVITWDRCMFFLGNYSGICENAWILEDDVAFRGGSTLSDFFASKSKSNADFMAAPPLIDNSVDTFLWKTLTHSGLKLRWASYNPICRVSRRFVQTLANFAQEKKRLFFLEYLFMSLALENGLKTEFFYELQGHFRYSPPISFEETLGAKVPIFHPVKDSELWNRIF